MTASQRSPANRVPVLRTFLMSAALFLLVVGAVVLGGFAYLVEPGPEGRVRHIASLGKLLLHRYALVDSLSPEEARLLYRNSCTRRCHSRDVVEEKPRTAREWEWIVTRMETGDRADLTDPQAAVITKYLQLNHLSNVPTILPEQTMRFIKKHLWRMDFGESDLYFDIIYIPREQRSLMPYLAFRSTPRDSNESLFIVYVNTHSGAVPQWDLAEIATLRDGRGGARRATGWEVLYEDGQQHHKQGILTFPSIGGDEPGVLEMTIDPPGMKKRVYQWVLPIPDAGEPGIQFLNHRENQD